MSRPPHPPLGGHPAAPPVRPAQPMGVVHQQLPPQQHPPTICEELLMALGEHSRHPIDRRLQLLKASARMLRLFNERYEEVVTTQAYVDNAQRLMNCLLRVIREMPPHFIMENETQQLRKITLEIIHRTPIERPQHNAQELQTLQALQALMLGVITTDNEENALLAIKILTDLIRNPPRLPFLPERARAPMDPPLFAHQPPIVCTSIDEEVQRSLDSLFFQRTMQLKQRDDTTFDYVLLPRALMSVRVHAELPTLLMLILHMHKGTLIEEIPRLLGVYVNYVAVYAARRPHQESSILDEFHVAQVRALNFVAFMGKNPQLSGPIFSKNAVLLTDAINNLLEFVSPHATATRRELMMAVKLFLAVENLRPQFVNIIPRLTTDRFLLGETCTSQDSLRNYLYSQIVDLIHHVRLNLTYPMFVHVYKVCIRCVHDSQLFLTYQSMYAKLMMNLCEPLVNLELESPQQPARDILLAALAALVKKTEIIAHFYLPQVTAAIEKAKRDAAAQQPAAAGAKEAAAPKLPVVPQPSEALKDAEVASSHSAVQPKPSIDLKDCRQIFKMIVQAFKVISVHLSKCHLTENSSSMYDELQLFTELFVQGVRCFDIFRLMIAQTQTSNQAKFVQKDELEIMEMFASIFIDGELSIVKRILTDNIEFFIERLIAYPALQTICSLFLDEKRHTSTMVGSIFMQHMLPNMAEKGGNSEKVHLYIRIFKQIFLAISRAGQEANGQRGVVQAEAATRNSDHEQMLMPFLHQIVAESTSLALRSREPYPYIHVLRALFRSIGTGSHDQLYQQFLPLLPSILQQLNRFQNGSYRLPIHELFVELCLTVPVRLSSLLPYLPLLMDPLVCALHGSPSLVQQGLRTLELCVDNLQPEYFYEHMSPVRAALMQGLWRALYTQDVVSSMSALRILGKLGGSSRRAFLDAQIFAFVDHADRSFGARALQAAQHAHKDDGVEREAPQLRLVSTVELSDRHRDAGFVQGDEGVLKRPHDFDGASPDAKRAHFDSSGSTDAHSLDSASASGDSPAALRSGRSTQQQLQLDLPVAQLVETAVGQIRLALPFLSESVPPISLNWAHWTAGVAAAQQTNKLPHQNAVEVCRSVLLNSLAGSPLLGVSSEAALRAIFKRAIEEFREKKLDEKNSTEAPFKCADSKSRAVLGHALSGLFYAVVSPDLCKQQLPVYRAIVGHLTMQALLESLSGGVQLDGEQADARELLDGSLLVDVICQTLSDSCKDFSQAAIVALRYINVVTCYLFDEADRPLVYALPFFARLLHSIADLCYRRDWFAKLGGCTALRFFMDHFPAEFVMCNADLLMNAFFTTISGLADEISSGALDGASKGLDQLLEVCTKFENVEERERILRTVVLPLLVQNLPAAEPLTRAEANRLVQKLAADDAATKARLFESERAQLGHQLAVGFAEFATMTVNSQLGFLDFFANHLLESGHVDFEYADKSAALVANLLLIVEHTDVALHSMPSARYAVPNLSRGSQSLEEQMRALRAAAFDALRTHCRALLLLKSRLEAGQTDEERQVQRIEMALRSLDIERIGAPKTKRAERLQLVLRTAFELAGVPLPAPPDGLTVQAAIKELRKLKDKLKRRFVGRDARSDERTEVDRRTDLIVRRLEAIVAELLDIVCNAHHPYKPQCKALLQTIIEAEPRFTAHVHARINDQFRRMRPYVQLNEAVADPQKALDFLEPNERLRLFPHSHRESATRAGEPPAAPVTDALQTTIVVDLNDRAVLERLMGGPVDVSVRDPDGNVVASGRSLGFAPIVAPSTEFEAENAPQHGRIHGPMTTFSSSSSRSKEATVKPDAPMERSQPTAEPMDAEGRPERNEAEDPRATDETTGQPAALAVEPNEEEMSDEATAADRPLNRPSDLPPPAKIFVVTGREGDQFLLSDYDGPMPPDNPGTYITLRTLPGGLQVRSVRNYNLDIGEEMNENETLYQQIQHKIAEVEAAEVAALAEAEARRRAGGQAGVSSAAPSSTYSMVFSDSEEATAAHMQIANMLMLEAQSLGLDQPSNAPSPHPSGRPSTSAGSRPMSGAQHLQVQQQQHGPKRRTSSGVSASDFQDLIDISDTDLREIGEELIQHLPDFPSPDKAPEQGFHQQQQQAQGHAPPHVAYYGPPAPQFHTARDPVAEVVASMRADAVARSSHHPPMESGASSAPPSVPPPQSAAHHGPPPPYQPPYSQAAAYAPYPPVQMAAGPTGMPHQHALHHAQQQQQSMMPQPVVSHSISYPSTPQQQQQAVAHHRYPQAPMLQQPMRYNEQENGLDAEYALRHQQSPAAQVATPGRPFESEAAPTASPAAQQTPLAVDQPGGSYSAPASIPPSVAAPTADAPLAGAEIAGGPPEQDEEEDSGSGADSPGAPDAPKKLTKDADACVDEYLLVHTHQKWEPPTVVHVPVRDGRACFGEAHAAAESGLRLDEPPGDEDELGDTLDDEPLLQHTHGPLHPLLLDARGRPLESAHVLNVEEPEKVVGNVGDDPSEQEDGEYEEEPEPTHRLDEDGEEAEMNAEELEELVDETAERIRTHRLEDEKQRERSDEEEDGSSLSSFEYVVLDRDLPATSKPKQRKTDVKTEAEEKAALQQTAEERKARRDAKQTTESPKEPLKRKHDVVLQISEITADHLKNIEITDEAVCRIEETMERAQFEDEDTPSPASSTSSKRRPPARVVKERPVVLRLQSDVQREAEAKRLAAQSADDDDDDEGASSDQLEAEEFDRLLAADAPPSARVEAEAERAEGGENDEEQPKRRAYDHVTNAELRVFLNALHERSPEQAKKAVDFYNRRMSALAAQQPAELELDEEGLRLEYVSENVRLPTGHTVAVLPRTQFNFLPAELMDEIREFDAEFRRAAVDHLAERVTEADGRWRPTDDEVERLRDVQSVSAAKLGVLADLRELADAPMPPQLLAHLCEEVGQLFKYKTVDECNAEQLEQVRATLRLMASKRVSERPFAFISGALVFCADVQNVLDVEDLAEMRTELARCLDLEAERAAAFLLQRKFLEIVACRRLAVQLCAHDEAPRLRAAILRRTAEMRALLMREVVAAGVEEKEDEEEAGAWPTDENERPPGDSDEAADRFRESSVVVLDERSGAAAEPMDVDRSRDEATAESADRSAVAPTENEEPAAYSKRRRNQIRVDYGVLQLLHTISEKTSDFATTAPQAAELVHEFWRSKFLRQRYGARRAMPTVGGASGAHWPDLYDSVMTAEKFAVPELCVRLLIAFFKSNTDRIDVLLSCCSAFCNDYVTDFHFFSKFIEDEIVPHMSLEWRRRAFALVIDFFRPRRRFYPTGPSNVLAKFMQHLLIPCFQHAFNNNPVDLVIGAPPTPSEPLNPATDNSIVRQICNVIINPYYDRQSTASKLPVSKLLLIQLYHFCALLVQRCPEHVHDNEQRQQGPCLSLFMLFGWPCLQQQYAGDAVEKYAGHYLSASLMDKFSISRNITMQAVKSMLNAHQIDVRDIVRKSLDVIVPPMSGRSDGNDKKLFETIKAVAEDSHNPPPVIIHCIGVITRHYKVFFRVRLQAADAMFRFIQRQLATQSSVEVKKVILDVCETMVKWEQHRQKLLEIAEAADPQLPKVPQAHPLPAVELENLLQQFSSRLIEQVLQYLLRLATTQEPNSQSPFGPDSLLRRALMLLCLAVKPQIFGHVPLRVESLKNLLNQLPGQEELLRHDPSGQQLRAAPNGPLLQKIQQTVDILGAMVGFLPPEAVPKIVNDLQAPLAGCLRSGPMMIAQSTVKFVSKLIEHTRTSANGLDEFGVLNAGIERYINETLVHVAQHGFPPQMPHQSTIATLSTSLSLVRIMCKQHPAYLDNVCMDSVLKMFARLVREYTPGNFALNVPGGAPVRVNDTPESREKNHQDMLLASMEILRARLPFVGADTRRLAFQAMFPLMDRVLGDRLIEKMLEILVEVIRVDTNGQPNYAGDLLYRLSMHAEKQLHANPALAFKFLVAVYSVFDDRELRKSELATKLQHAFWRALAFPHDRNLRHQFYRIFESQFPEHLFDRLLYALTEQHWTPLQSHFWIPLLLNLLMRAAVGAKATINAADAAADRTTTNARLQLTNCASFARTSERLFERLHLAAIANAQDDAGVMHVDGGERPTAGSPSGNLDPKSEISAHELVVHSGKTLCDLINNTRLEDVVRNVAELAYSDARLARALFVRFFASVWNQMPEATVKRRTTIARFFLVTGELSAADELPITPLNCFYEAFARSKHPVPVDSSTLEYIATHHDGWYAVIDRIERQLRRVANSRQLIAATPKEYPKELHLMDTLSALYERLGERDLLADLWRRRACLDGTVRALTLFNQGLLYDSRLQARIAMERGLLALESDEFGDKVEAPAVVPIKPEDAESSNEPAVPATTALPAVEEAAAVAPTGVWPSLDAPDSSAQPADEEENKTVKVRCIDGEMRLLERQWLQSCRELNDWSTLERWANHAEIADEETLATAAWHQSDWTTVRTLAEQIEAAGTRRTAYEGAFLHAMAAVARGTDHTPTPGGGPPLSRARLDELSGFLIGEWRALPSIVSAPHADLLRKAQQIQEITEANQIVDVAARKLQRGVPPSTPGGTAGSANLRQFQQLPQRYGLDSQLVGDIKQTTKTWRNRPLTIVDPVAHWSDTYCWRVQEYLFVMQVLENGPDFQLTHPMLPKHSIAQSQINLARTLRKAGLFDEAAHELATLHSLNQVYPADAIMMVLEQAKCIQGMAAAIVRRQRYGEDGVDEHQLQFDYGTRPYERDLNGRTPVELREKALNILNAAKVELLTGDLAARFFAAKATLLDELAVDGAEVNAERLAEANRTFAMAAQLCEGAQLNSQASMSIGIYVWKHWSLHLEAKFVRQMKRLNAPGGFNYDLCLDARRTALETLVTLLECLRTAPAHRSKKYGARFFHLLRAVRVLESRLKVKQEALVKLEDAEIPMETDEAEAEALTIESVLQRHAAAVPAINWTFWIDKIAAEIRDFQCAEMRRILCAVAEAYPQQTLVVLRTALNPDLITLRIEYVQQQLPLIADWIRCAPPLDDEGDEEKTAAADGSPAKRPADDEKLRKLREIRRLLPSEERFADSFTLWRARRRDRQLAAAARRLRRFDTRVRRLKREAGGIAAPAAREFAAIRRKLEARYLRLKHLKKNHLLPAAPERLPAAMDMTRPRPELPPWWLDTDEEESGEEGQQKPETRPYRARIHVPATGELIGRRVRLDTSEWAQEGYELVVRLTEDRDPDAPVDEELRFDANDAEPVAEQPAAAAKEMLLTAVDAMCVQRFADVKAMNTILNELDALPMEWTHTLHSALVRLGEFIHSETFKLVSTAPPNDRPLLECSPEIIEALQRFVRFHLKPPTVDDDEMEVDERKEEDADRELRNVLNAEVDELRTAGWPLLRVARRLCAWIEQLVTRLRDFDRIVPLRTLSPQLAAFNGRVAHLDVCSHWVATKSNQFTTQIAHFLPLCRQFFRPDGVQWALSVLSQNGKTYTYALQRRPFSVHSLRVQQTFALLNAELLKSREVCTRNAQFPVPDVFHTGRRFQVVECSPMSGAWSFQLFTNAERYGANLRSLADLSADCLRLQPAGTSGEPPARSLWTLLERKYTEMEVKLEATETKPEQQPKSSDLPNDLFDEWMHATYPDAATFWTIRKRLATQWALYAAAELALGLRPMRLPGMFLELNSAQLFCIDGYRFDLKAATEEGPIELPEAANRLTPNIAEYLRVDVDGDDVHLSGHLSGAYMAITRAFASKSYGAYLQSAIWDLVPAAHKAERKEDQWTVEGGRERTFRAALELPDELAERIKRLAVFTRDGFRALVQLEAAAKPAIVRRLDPAQNPWF